MDSSQHTEAVEVLKPKRTSRFGFNRKSVEKTTGKDPNENIEKQQQRQPKKVQAVKPVSKAVSKPVSKAVSKPVSKPRKERQPIPSFEEPFPEVSGKPMDIFEEAKKRPQKSPAQPLYKKKLLSKARFFGDTASKPPKPARGQATSTSSDDIDEDNFVILSNPEKQGIFKVILKNVFFVYYFMTSWLV